MNKIDEIVEEYKKVQNNKKLVDVMNTLDTDNKLFLITRLLDNNLAAGLLSNPSFKPYIRILLNIVKKSRNK